MASRVIYTPYIPKPIEIPESIAIQPIPISLSKSDGEGAIPGEQLLVRYNLSTPAQESETPKQKSLPSITWSANSPKIAGTYKDRNKFVSDLTSAYEKELENRGLSKEYAKYIVAQDALESNWGSSSLARYFNFGGIKETRDGQGVKAKTKESYDGKTLTNTTASFRQFDSLDDYVNYKLDLLGNSNYDVFSYRPDQLYTRLVTAKNKYATDPDYLNKMNRMYQSILALS